MHTKLAPEKIQATRLRNESNPRAATGRSPSQRLVLAPMLRTLLASMLLLPAQGAWAAAVLTSIHSFEAFTNGAFPAGALVLGTDGNFYGTTGGGGTNTGSGTVFRISTNGVLTSLYSFTGGNDGGGPNGLTLASDGNFYGTTEEGGTNNWGTVFKITTNGVLTSLYSFTGGDDGANPSAALAQGSDGSLYGTTYDGGPYAGYNVYTGYGTVFKISTNGALTNLYYFTGGNDGGNPEAGLLQAADGSFYGTTYGGGVGGVGSVFRLTIQPAFQRVTLTNRTLNLTWSTEVGGKYQLQFNPGFTSGTWTNVGVTATASGSTLSGTDSVTNGARRVYRVMVVP